MKHKTAVSYATSLLARREHSVKELTNKLNKAGFDHTDIDQAINSLQQAGYQDDSRFCENYLRYRSQRGYGSQRIRAELKERGIAPELISEALQQADIDWFALAIEVRCKRFGEQSPQDYKERAKQQRFLQYRGFTHEQITESFNTDS